MFFSKNLLGVDHCFFTKLGGVSTGQYSSLNCGNGSGDDRKKINKNLKFVANYFDLDINNVFTLHQFHSNKVLKINNHNLRRQNLYYDGLVTNKKNVILGILTADCAPVLFYAPVKQVIGACHAGWKGALTGIIENTISKMQELGSKPQDIRCAIGPCIAQESYEVGKDFYDKFLNENQYNSEFFIKKSLKKGKYKFSLRNFIINKLSIIGTSSTNSIIIDTYKSEHICFSYRKSLNKKENDYGRMISTIVIKD